MVWGSISAVGPRNLHFIAEIMDRHKNLQFLEQNVTTSAQKLDIANCFSFYQDNGPKRKTVNVQLWLLYNCTHILQTPPQSADLNVVEHLYLEENLKNRSIFNMKDLKNSLKYE